MKKRTHKLKYADSMAQAAAILGIPVETLKRAKEMGCSAFRGSRVYCEEVTKWLRANPEVVEEASQVAFDEAERRKMLADAELREERLKLLRRQVIPVDEVRRSFTKAVIAAKSKLLAIPSTLCQPLAILTDPIEVEERLKKAVREALQELAKTEWSKATCEHCGKEIEP